MPFTNPDDQLDQQVRLVPHEERQKVLPVLDPVTMKPSTMNSWLHKRAVYRVHRALLKAGVIRPVGGYR